MDRVRCADRSSRVSDSATGNEPRVRIEYQDAGEVRIRYDSIEG